MEVIIEWLVIAALVVGAAYLIFKIISFFLKPLKFIGAALGLLAALYALISAGKIVFLRRKEINSGQNEPPGYSQKNNAEPAFRSYIFSGVFEDIWYFVKQSMQELYNVIKSLDSKILSHELGVITKLLQFLLVAIVTIVGAVAGGIITVMLSIIVVILSLFGLVVAYIAFSLLWLVDTIFLRIKGIAQVCGTCHNRFVRPIFICPNCGAPHKKLIPGKYGVIRRRCLCGTKLPTSVFNRKHPRRSDLETWCPICYERDTVTQVLGLSSRPVVIPVVGATSVGKSSYIAAYSHVLAEQCRANGVIIKPGNESDREQLQQLERYYSQGDMAKTAPESNERLASAKEIRIFLSGNGVSPERLLHVYDIAGETFTASEENEDQVQYNHAHGVVLVLDPFSIREVYAKYQDELQPEDSASVSPVDPDDVVETLLHKVAEVTGISSKQAYDIPLAVVINKIDASHSLRQIFSQVSVKEMVASGEAKNERDALDISCRKFLINFGQGNIVKLLDEKFKKNRFFPLSAMGHAAGNGQYQPIHVTDPIDWIFANEDPKLANALAAALPSTSL